jgi:O-6-methylguanine DNA methyltransferase
MTIFYQAVKSPIGTIHAYADDQTLLAICLGSQFKTPPFLRSKKREIIKKSNPILAQVQSQLGEYFSGKRSKFQLPLNISGTPFQIQAWKALQKIPYGSTATYAEQSRAINRDRAVRAVGTANSKNIFPIVIPCHRVVRSDGSLGGYAGGLKLKAELLKLEQRQRPSKKSGS